MEQGTEEATPRKLRKARERGEVAESPLATAALVLLGGATALAFGAEEMVASFRGLIARLFTTSPAPQEALALAATVGAGALVWPLAAVVCCGALGSFLQTGPLFAPRALAPDAARLDPVRGLSRMFSPAALASQLGALALALGLFAIGAAVLGAALPGLAGRTTGGAGFVLEAIHAVLGALLVRALLLVALAGAVAFVAARWRFFREQRMTRRELQDEQREIEGEPHARRRRAELHREAALGPSVDEALEGAAIVVRGVGRAVIVRWSADARPVVSLAAQGPQAQRVVAAATDDIAVVRDEVLVGALERLSAGRTLPRSALLRLARHLARRRAR